MNFHRNNSSDLQSKTKRISIRDTSSIYKFYLKITSNVNKIHTSFYLLRQSDWILNFERYDRHRVFKVFCFIYCSNAIQI